MGSGSAEQANPDMSPAGSGGGVTEGSKSRGSRKPIRRSRTKFSKRASIRVLSASNTRAVVSHFLDLWMLLYTFESIYQPRRARAHAEVLLHRHPCMGGGAARGILWQPHTRTFRPLAMFTPSAPRCHCSLPRSVATCTILRLHQTLARAGEGADQPLLVSERPCGSSSLRRIRRCGRTPGWYGAAPPRVPSGWPSRIRPWPRKWPPSRPLPGSHRLLGGRGHCRLS